MQQRVPCEDSGVGPCVQKDKKVFFIKITVLSNRCEKIRGGVTSQNNNNKECV